MTARPPYAGIYLAIHCTHMTPSQTWRIGHSISYYDKSERAAVSMFASRFG